MQEQLDQKNEEKKARPSADERGKPIEPPTEPKSEPVNPAPIGGTPPPAENK